MMGSKAFLFLGLLLAIFAMISSEVAARELTETPVKLDNKNVKVEHSDEQYPSGGYKGYGEYNGYKSSGDGYKHSHDEYNDVYKSPGDGYKYSHDEYSNGYKSSDDEYKHAHDTQPSVIVIDIGDGYKSYGDGFKYSLDGYKNGYKSTSGEHKPRR
ncbi:glycine-rich protein HC1, partial [Capsicum annuum]|uniref:glycine-rich protein HC1 n=1 Tax=Capsicum annuum TaxID=4072 RepID=UPI001FB0BF79